ncbi:TRAP transporter substrate-binding protein DctP [Chelatococcus sp. GCM10030263]|uniref:TRAP transporter substrate-binding protein DctP n=1 Tax=Chelatococcus sp. GCM10030263 TaxID=3273387 RepID=UPI00362347F1
MTTIRSKMAGAMRIGLAAMASMVLLSVGSEAAERVVWRAYTYNTVATVVPNVGLTRMFEEIEKKSNGMLHIDLHLGGSLPINATNITAAVSDDVVTLADDAFFTGNIQIGNLLRMPLLLQSFADYKTAQEIIFPYMERAYAKKGIILLGQYTYPPAVFWSRKKLEGVKDIAGQKIRTSSTEQSELVRRFGGIPVTITTPEVAPAVDRGVIDGNLTNSGSVNSLWRDLFKYRYDLPTSFVNAPIIVNQAAFEQVPPETQAIVREAAKGAVSWITDAILADEDRLTQKLVTETGLKDNKASPTDIKAVEAGLVAYWEQWAKDHGPEAVEALARIRAAVGR